MKNYMTLGDNNTDESLEKNKTIGELLGTILNNEESISFWKDVLEGDNQTSENLIESCQAQQVVKNDTKSPSLNGTIIAAPNNYPSSEKYPLSPPVPIPQRPVPIPQRPVPIPQRPVPIPQRPVPISQRPVPIPQRPVPIKSSYTGGYTYPINPGYYGDPTPPVYRSGHVYPYHNPTPEIPPELTTTQPKIITPNAIPHSPQYPEENSCCFTFLSSAYKNFLAFYKVFKEDCVEAFTFGKKSAGNEAGNRDAKPSTSMTARFWEALTSMVPDRFKSNSNSEKSETTPLLPKQR